MNMIQTFDIVDNDIPSLQAYLDARNAENKVVSYAYSPHSNSHFSALTIEHTNVNVTQIIDIKDVSDISGINLWISDRNAEDYSVNFIQVRHITNDLYLLATKYIPI